MILMATDAQGEKVVGEHTLVIRRGYDEVRERFGRLIGLSRR